MDYMENLPGMDSPLKKRSKAEFNTYGLILILASFVLRFLTVGILQCFGIILRELIDLYNVGKGELNWIPSVNNGCMLMLAPLSGMVDDKIGNRLSILLGTLIASIGLATSMVVPNIYFLYLTYGVITGTGYSLVFHAVTVSVNLYFTKRRTLAHSIANIGNGFGATLMPLLLTSLLEHLGWRGTLLIFSGMYLQGLICGMLFHPVRKPLKHDELLPHLKKEQQKLPIWKETKMLFENPLFVMYAISAVSVMSVFNVPFFTIPVMMSSYGYTTQEQAMVITTIGITNIIQLPIGGIVIDKIQSFTFMTMGVAVICMGGSTFAVAFMRGYPLFILYGVLFGISAGIYSNLQPVGLLNVINRECYGLGLGYPRLFLGVGILLGPPIAGVIQCFGIILRELIDLYNVGKGELNWIPSVNSGCMLLLGPLSGMVDGKIGNRLSILLGTLIASIGLVTSMVVPNFYFLYLTYGVITDDELLPDLYQEKPKMSCWKKTKKVIKNPYFIMYTTSAFCVVSVLAVPLLMLPSMMSSYGYTTQQQAVVITTVGITNLIQCPVGGILIDKIKSFTLMAMGVITGGSTFAVAFMREYPLFILYGVLFGLGSGIYGNLQALGLLDVIDRECYGFGLGYFRQFVGVGILLGPPIAGWITDARGRFDMAFYFTAALFTLGGLFLIILNLIIRYRTRQRLETDNELQFTKTEMEDTR